MLLLGVGQLKCIFCALLGLLRVSAKRFVSDKRLQVYFLMA